MDQQLPLRPNVCMLVTNGAGLFFLGEREGEPGIWQFPQGGVEQGAPIEESVLRELEEELGCDRSKFEIVRQLQTTNQYEWREAPRYGKDKWRGQSQTFWLVRFLGQDSDITLQSDSVEFMSHRWVTAEEVLAMADPIRVSAYRRVFQELAIVAS